MDSFESGVTISKTPFNPINFKQCDSELKRLGLERLLCAVYRRQVTMGSLLLELGADREAVAVLRHKNLALVAEEITSQIKGEITKTYLGERGYQIVERFFGLDGFLPGRLAPIANKHGVSRERIRQIKERAIRVLRARKAHIEGLLLSMSMAMVTPRLHFRPHVLSAIRDESKDFELLSHRHLLFLDQANLPLLQEQTGAISNFEEARRLRVIGCAGSGKTILALLLARKLAQSGKRTLLTCFSRASSDYLSYFLNGEANLTVSSFHSLCLRLGRETGLTIPGGWNSSAWVDRIPELLRRAFLSSPGLRFDAIIVDDGHDLRDNWWDALEAGLKDPVNGLFIYFQDDNRFREVVTSYCPGVNAQSRLSTNLRTPVLASPFLLSSYLSSNKMHLVRNVDEPLEFYPCQSNDDVHRVLAHVFAELTERGSYLPSDIAVLTPRMPRFSSAFKVYLKRGSRIVTKATERSIHAVLSRFHTFQGLERKVIIIVDLDDRFAELSTNHIKYFVYMTFSRFIDKLVILGSTSSWQVIDKLTVEGMDSEPLPPASRVRMFATVPNVEPYRSGPNSIFS